MPAKFQAYIRRSNTPDITAYVEAQNEHEAKSLLEMQYGRGRVLFVKEVPFSNTDGYSSYDGLSDGFSDDRKRLAPIVGIVVILWFVFQGYQKFVQPLFAGSPPAAGAPATVQVEAPSELPQAVSSATVAPAEVTAPSIPAAAEVVAKQPEATRQDPVPETVPTPEIRPESRLKTFVATIRVPGGETKTLQLSAKSADDARRIFHDFRGNPEIIDLSESN